MAQYVGEFRETVGFFENILKHTGRAVKHLRRGRFKKAWMSAKRSMCNGPTCNLGSLSAAFLTARWGINPLLQDLDTLLHNQEPLNPIVKLSATDERELHFSQTGSGGRATQWTKRNRYLSRDRTVAYVRLRHDWRAWTAGNPLEAIWEGVPFSWLVDYFFSVGDYLQSIDALNGVDVVAATTTSKREIRGVVEIEQLTGSTLYSGELFQPGVCYWRENRRLLSTLPYQFTPRWEPSPSIGRVFNALAVLDQLRRSR
jgi:hypothetical protein